MTEIVRVLAPGGVFVAVDTFRARQAQVLRRVRIPLCVYQAMTAASLAIAGARLCGGFGPGQPPDRHHRRAVRPLRSIGPVSSW